MAAKATKGPKKECAVPMSPNRGKGMALARILNDKGGDKFPRVYLEFSELRDVRKPDLMRLWSPNSQT